MKAFMFSVQLKIRKQSRG